MEQWKARLKALAEDGTITQERADAVLAQVTECMASCDGTSCGNQGRCGRNSGNGRRGGQGRGMGCGRRG